MSHFRHNNVSPPGPTLTDWNGVIAELFELDKTYKGTESHPDSSSGIASDPDHHTTTSSKSDKEVSPRVTAYKEHLKQCQKSFLAQQQAQRPYTHPQTQIHYADVQRSQTQTQVHCAEVHTRPGLTTQGHPLGSQMQKAAPQHVQLTQNVPPRPPSQHAQRKPGYHETDLDDPYTGCKFVYHPESRCEQYRRQPSAPFRGFDHRCLGQKEQVHCDSMQAYRRSPLWLPSSSGSESNHYDNHPLNYEGRQTGYESHSSGYEGHQPGYDSHSSGYEGHQTGYDGHQPGYEGHQPGYERQPGFDNHTTGLQSHQVGYDNKQYQISYFDILPDDVLTKIFASLSSDQLCRCARVCHRWFNVVWDHSLWTTLRVNNSELNVDKGLKCLTRRLSYDTPSVCVMVERINLAGCEQLTDKGLLTIARRCPELRHLDVQGCMNITNIALFEVVSRCVNLEHLNVAGCACITCICLTPEATVQAATYGKQIDIRFLDMTDCYNLDDAGLQMIASYCPKLTHLYLRRCHRVTDIGVQYVANYCTQLRELSICDCRNVTDFGLREMSKLGGNLRYLSIAKCEKLSDLGVKYVAGSCHKLRYLNMRGCEAVSDEAIDMVARYCPRLKSLDIGKCDVTDECLRVLGERLPGLRKLSVRGCEGVTDRGVAHIAQRCRHLQQLNIQECHVTIDGYRTVKKCCKHCMIEHTNPGFF